MLGRNYVCCLFIVVHFDKPEQKGVKSSIAGGESHERGTLFIGKGGSHYVMLLYCETLLQVLLGIYCN